ncbi:listerin E3 ubiquitin protein ligase 1 [Boothiomyces sp. JEL0866]|nr:listerin E3 ubiquitin protein ligase 1 [Boothiomyces sp. JEL0866]
MLTAVNKPPVISGKLELIIGCMFSGKSTELISRIRKHKIIESNYIVINHSKDTRYDENQIVSHNLDKEGCYSTTHLLPFIETKAYEDHHVFFIEEAQFFPDLLEFVSRAVDTDFKHVIVCGLDGDYQRRPIGQVLQLIPIADTVDKLRALCAICKDGTEALFSLRRTSDTSVELIGGIDEYLPVCRMSKKPRVKGNPTAANSARAQQFLGQNYSFGLGAIEDYSNLEPDLRVILRKLNKKDSITKSKALEELLVYFNENSIQDDAITAWANLFPKIATDIDRKVREICFAVHQKLVNRAKKQFGIIIKQIIGTWIISQFDNSKEVAKLATESFQAAFPLNTNKTEQVLVYCLEEIQDYLTSNILHQSADTLSDARFATRDEMDAKYHRVISGSIDGLGFVIQNLSYEKRINSFATVLSSKTFWTFSSHISSHVRGAMYRLVSTLTRKGQDVIENFKDLIASQFLAKVFNDKESVAYSYMWEAILLLSKNYPDMWILASAKKPILPKVLQFLKSGTHGSGKLSYPCLLPLIGHIPNELLTESPDFYTEFFLSFWTGHNMIDRNSSESFAEAYYECLRFVLRKDQVGKEKELMTKYLFLPLEGLLHGKSGKILYEDVLVAFLKVFKSLWFSLKDEEQDLIKIYTIGMLEQVINPRVETNELQAANVSLGDFLNRLQSSADTESLLEFSKYINNSLINIIVYLLQTCEDAEKVEKLLHLLCVIIPIGKITDDNIDILLNFAKESQFIDNDRYTLLGIQAILETILKASSGNLSRVKNVWADLLEKLSSKNDLKLFNFVLERFKTADLPSLYSTVLENQLRAILESAGLIGEIETKFVVDLIWNADYFLSESVILNFYNSLTDFIILGRSKLMKFDTESIELVPNEILKLLFGLQVISELSKKACSQFSGIIFELTELSHCKPLSVAEITWRPNLPPGASEFTIFESIYSEANTCISNLLVQSNSYVAPYVPKLITRWLEESFTENYCASASDCVSIFKTLFKFVNQHDFIKVVQLMLDSKENWTDPFVQFIQFYDDSVELQNNLHSWRISNQSIEPNIIYDFDGLSSYAKRGIIYCTLLKDETIRKHVHEPWILLELERIKQICIYTRYTPHSLFNANSPIQSDHLVRDIEELLDHTLRDIDENTIELLQLQLEKKENKIGGNIVLQAFASGYEVVEQANYDMKISNCEIFSSLLSRYLEINPQPSLVLVRLLHSIIETADAVLVSAGLTAIVPCIKSHLELSTIFEKLLKTVLAIKKSDIESKESRKNITLLFHFLFPNGVALEESFFNEQNQKAFMRWVRTLFDAYIAQPVDHKLEQSSESVLIHAHITAILTFFINEITREAYDLGINMNRFVVDLVGYFFRQFKQSEITPAIGCHLYHSIALWEALKTAYEEDEDSWVKVGDVQNQIEHILLSLFIETGHPDKVKVSGFPILQSKLSLHISLIDLSGSVKDLREHEELIYNLLFTDNEQVQINAYKILQILVAKEVESKSLEIEMNTTGEVDSICLNTYLTGNLLRSVDPSVNYTSEFFGKLLSWMVLFDHFKDTTFELRQLYITHIRNLDIFNKFLEMIFDLLNVGTLLPTFDLSNWDIEEFLMEYFDKNSPTAISLLCSHLYLRALKSAPTLTKIWFTECKNRQLLLGVESFTEKHFSKLLIANECASLETHVDDDFSVKFNPNSHEINAAYKFEEAELDIVIKLPSCYPLKQIDISAGTAGGRQAGISEARWRGWLLSITSVITGQNGTVSDAIYLFKKNVKLHFEGIEDCAICYSVISAIDRSTPQKKCRNFTFITKNLAVNSSAL